MGLKINRGEENSPSSLHASRFTRHDPPPFTPRFPDTPPLRLLPTITPPRALPACHSSPPHPGSLSDLDPETGWQLASVQEPFRAPFPASQLFRSDISLGRQSKLRANRSLFPRSALFSLAPVVPIWSRSLLLLPH